MSHFIWHLLELLHWHSLSLNITNPKLLNIAYVAPHDTGPDTLSSPLFLHSPSILGTS